MQGISGFISQSLQILYPMRGMRYKSLEAWAMRGRVFTHMSHRFIETASVT
jgi:hypothetical protein